MVGSPPLESIVAPDDQDDRERALARYLAEQRQRTPEAVAQHVLPAAAGSRTAAHDAVRTQPGMEDSRRGAATASGIAFDGSPAVIPDGAATRPIAASTVPELAGSASVSDMEQPDPPAAHAMAVAMAASPLGPGAATAAVFRDGFLTASVEDGILYIIFNRHVVTGSVLGVFRFDVFIDADRNRNTGDYRNGHLGGIEYHIRGSFDSFSGGNFNLYQVPTTPKEASDYFLPVSSYRSGFTGEKLLKSGSITDLGSEIIGFGLRLTDIPTPAGETPAAVNLAASARLYLSDGAIINPLRAPDYGFIDTGTGQVVVPKAGVQSDVYISDPQGEVSDAEVSNASSIDLIGVRFTTTQDQEIITLDFAGPINVPGYQLSGDIWPEIAV